MDTPRGVSKREFLIFFYKYRWRLIFAFLLPFALAVAVSFIPVPRYTADSVLVVRLGAEYVYQPEVGSTVNAPSSVIPFDRDQIFKSEVAILNSKNLHEKVIQTIGLERLFPPADQTLPLAQLKHFIKHTLMNTGILPPEKVLSPEEEERQKLAAAIEKFEKRFGILLEKDSAVINLSFEHEDQKIATDVLQTLMDDYFEQRKELYLDPRANLAETEMKSKRGRVSSALAAVEHFKQTHKLYSLEDQRRELLDQLAAAKERARVISNPALEMKIADYSSQLQQLDAQEREFARLNNEVEIAKNSYDLYSHKLDEAKTYENIQHQEADSVRVIQPPAASAEPKKIQFMIVIGGFFLALLNVLVVAAYTEFSRNGFLTPEEIERHINLPVLAVIPLYKNR